MTNLKKMLLSVAVASLFVACGGSDSSKGENSSNGVGIDTGSTNVSTTNGGSSETDFSSVSATLDNNQKFINAIKKTNPFSKSYFGGLYTGPYWSKDIKIRDYYSSKAEDINTLNGKALYEVKVDGENVLSFYKIIIDDKGLESLYENIEKSENDIDYIKVEDEDEIDPVIGNEGEVAISFNGNEAIGTTKGHKGKHKYLGSVSATLFNTEEKIFKEGSKVYGLASMTVESYSFDEIASGYIEDSRYRTFSEFISKHKKGGEELKSRYSRKNGQFELAAKLYFSEGSNSGNLVEYLNGEVINANAGTWKIKRNSDLGIDILYVKVSVDGYYTFGQDIYAVKDGYVYEGTFNKDLMVVQYYLDENAKNDLKKYFLDNGKKIGN